MSDNRRSITLRFASCRTAAGADFVAELVDTFLEEAPRMLAELRSAADAAAPSAFAAPRTRSSRTANTFGAMTLAAWRASSSSAASMPPTSRGRSTRWTRNTRARPRALKELAPWLKRGARLLVADDNKVNRLLLLAQPRAAGTSRRLRRERPGRAGDAARASRSTWCCSTWRCRRWTASRCSSSSRPTGSCATCR